MVTVTPTFLSIEYDGLRAGNEITVKYKIQSHFISSYFKACLVLNGKDCPSSTLPIRSANLLDWNYIYETKTTFVNNVNPGTKCSLRIYCNLQNEDHYVETLQENSNPARTCVERTCAKMKRTPETKCPNCGDISPSTWRLIDGKRHCNACSLYYKKHKINRITKVKDGKPKAVRKPRKPRKLTRNSC